MTDKEINLEDIELNDNRVDYVTSAAKSALSMIPFAGSFLAEIAGNIIPNQRINRIVKYVKALQNQLSKLDEAVMKANLSNENFSDLIEESLRQAASSLSDERRIYISSLVANSIASDDIEYFESKHLLRILGELNDIEVIWLRFYLYPNMGGDSEFRKKHKHIIAADLGSTAHAIDKSTLKDSYRDHLASIGLLEKQIEMGTFNHGSEIDSFGQDVKLKTTGYVITSLGILLLRELGYSDERFG